MLDLESKSTDCTRVLVKVTGIYYRRPNMPYCNGKAYLPSGRTLKVVRDLFMAVIREKRRIIKIKSRNMMLKDCPEHRSDMTIPKKV